LVKERSSNKLDFYKDKEIVGSLFMISINPKLPWTQNPIFVKKLAGFEILTRPNLAKNI